MNDEQTYQETIEFMYKQLPMFTRVGAAAYKANLDNAIALCEALGNPHHSFKSIHIAGTNGKGSCSYMLARIFEKNNYKTGLYTSPHIVDFRERIQINHTYIDKAFVVDFIKQVQTLIEKLKPSFFELTMAMAFYYFSKEKVDIAIIEVGMGGLLDSTNILEPLLSIITNISLDHTQFLGNSLEEIAIQKSGIMKKDTPVIIGEANEELEKIFFAQSVLKKAPLFFAERFYQKVSSEVKDNFQYIKFFSQKTNTFIPIKTDLLGSYQSKNIATVLTAIDIIKNNNLFNLSKEKSMEALEDIVNKADLKGRMHKVQSKPDIIFDVSHNKAGIYELIQQIQQTDYQHVYFIIGFVADKDVDIILTMFPSKNASFAFVQASSQRALPKEALWEAATKYNLNGSTYDTITQALETNFHKLHASDALVVCGSFYILDEAYTWYKNLL
ncbi:MAG: folylpolyglutamate synthase/dihydrofolate synthase family protein [Chitinophagaceae bacterium]